MNGGYSFTRNPKRGKGKILGKTSRSLTKSGKRSDGRGICNECLQGASMKGQKERAKQVKKKGTGEKRGGAESIGI